MAGTSARSFGVIALAAAVFAGMTARTVAAPRRPPEISPAERELRALVQPLREGVTDPAELPELVAWIAKHAASGPTELRGAGRELRHVLTQIHRDYLKDLTLGVELLELLARQRQSLFHALSREKMRIESAREEFAKISPVPPESEVIPLLLELPAVPNGQVAAPAPATDDGNDPLLPEGGATEVRETTAADLDERAVVDRITADLTALQHLYLACQDEREKEEKRHKEALATLTKLVKSPESAALQK